MAPGKQQPVNTPSVLTENLFVPNPFYDRINGLIDNDFSLIYDLMDIDDPDIIDKLLNNPEVCALIDNAVDQFIDTPDTKPTMPPPPQAQSVYLRVNSNAVVHDLGSGDGRKASKCQAKITMCDKLPRAEFVKYADIDEINFDQDVLYTSYNALTQLQPDTVERVLTVEGLHLYPDMDYIRHNLGSVEIDVNKYLTVSGGEEFIDYSTNIHGDEITTGYHVKNSYCRRTVEFFNRGKKCKIKPFDVPIFDTLVQLPGLATPKYDGLALLLKCDGNVCRLGMRNGNGYILEGHSEVDFVLLLERFPIDGPALHYILLRVAYYRGRVPFHGLNGLRDFCQAVNVIIDGVRVTPPGHHTLLGLPSDGVIYRVEGADYRLKNVLTVDCYWGTLREILKRNGIAVDFIGAFAKDRMLEFSVTSQPTGCYTFRFVRYRFDKGHETPEDVILHSLSLAPREFQGDDDDDSVY